MTDYERIEKAIIYLKENFRDQPGLDRIAGQVHLSPFHFQRLFKNWAGVSPKKFVQFLSLEYAKQLLEQDRSLSDVSFETGLSGTSRLHDLFISIEGMTPGEYKSGGEALRINYSFAETLFGDILIASTPKGICLLVFVESESQGASELRSRFPRATLTRKTDLIQQEALKFFNHDWSDLSALKLHLKGTPFQLKVWRSLLQVPMGGMVTYSSVAKRVEMPKASRAIGSAVAGNPVAFLIPCHRVIRSTGITGDYHWGAGRKAAILGWEAARTSPGS